MYYSQEDNRSGTQLNGEETVDMMKRGGGGNNGEDKG